MFKYIPDLAASVLHVKEMENMSTSLRSLLNNNNYYHKKKAVDEALAFLNWFILYTKKAVNKKRPIDDILAQIVFKQSIKPKHYREYFDNHLLIASDYCKILAEKLNISNIQGYQHSLTNLYTDLEELVCLYEKFVVKSITNFSLNTGRRMGLNPTDIFYAAKAMFWIQDIKSVHNLYLRDLKPVVMFEIRQALEVYGRNLLGIDEILDKNKNTVKKFTQITWDLILEEIKRKPTRIYLSFNPHTISILNRWANDFVHTTFLYSEYLQYFALNLMSTLFQPTKTYIKTYDGKRTNKFNIADIRITNYESLKADIEKELDQRQPGITVSWLPVTKVGAYIISL